MLRKGFVYQDQATGKYGLGLKNLQLGAAAIKSINIRSIARPYLEYVVEQCNETTNLVVFDAGDAVYVDQMESSSMVKTMAETGARLPAYCTGGGKALLAYRDPKEVEELYGTGPLETFTEKTIKSVQELKQVLNRIRIAGYAVDDEEREIGVKCVAAPIFDLTGQAIAALSVSGPSFRLTDRVINQKIAQLVMETSAILSRSLGYEKEGDLAGRRTRAGREASSLGALMKSKQA